MTPYQERADFILNQLEQLGEVRVKELSACLNCSEVTIRGDIRRLEGEGLLKRTHGGAINKVRMLEVLCEPGEYTWNQQEKARIASCAYEYINNRDSIIIDDSTTGGYLAKVIRQHPQKHIIVITNSLLAAAELSAAKHVELFIVSGHVVGAPPAALDNFTIDAFHQFRVSKAFIGTNGISLRDGLFSLGAPQRDVKKAIISVSNEVYVLADHTKFDGGNLFNICGMDEVTRVITDSKVSEEIIKETKERGIYMDVV